jgi:membrane-bound metal-dependent hydrolase YbcI (DUF457 family)
VAIIMLDALMTQKALPPFTSFSDSAEVLVMADTICTPGAISSVTSVVTGRERWR